MARAGSFFGVWIFLSLASSTSQEENVRHCEATETRCRKSEFVLAHPFVRTGKRSVRTKLWQRVLCGDGNGVAVCVARSYLFSFVVCLEESATGECT